jgi:hypothetical protein
MNIVNLFLLLFVAFLKAVDDFFGQYLMGIFKLNYLVLFIQSQSSLTEISLKLQSLFEEDLISIGFSLCQ